MPLHKKVHAILKELVHKAVNETLELKQYPTISSNCSLNSTLQTKQLGSLLDEDPAIMERRTALAKRLELYRSAQAEIDAVAWAK
ncbi:hypothetical protein GW17_00023842 [Ensete ventricosum]|nr:hypothetical protein GW17_00023842 [Ensete ventricosum]RZR99197.1 hypothetical protein BHM03_00028697 [Ensete ventricosum]